MFNLILYTIPAIVLLIGLLVYFVGCSRKDNKLKGIGIGLITSLIALKSPNLFRDSSKGLLKDTMTNYTL